MFTVRWADDSIELIDQRLLPFERCTLKCKTVEELACAIEGMAVRGAPAIGVAAAFSMALAAREDEPRKALACARERLLRTRPTAINLAWGVQRVENAVRNVPDEEVAVRALAEAQRLLEEDIARNRALGHHGSALLEDGDTVLTHCNAGALATGGYGTALGVIRAAIEAGKRIKVVADETRPRLQGARLTMFELMEDGIPARLIPDGASGLLMRRGMVQKVVVGADRIAANGDVANKVGTYMVALAAQDNGIPFYVAAPTSTIDPETASAEDIVIEERDENEVLAVLGTPIAPPGARAYNYAFDITPARLITAIITEQGVFPPGEVLRSLND